MRLMSGAGQRIAVVDDDPSVRKALGRLLSIAHFNVETFASAREFLRACRDHSFECLIADLHMPEATGLDLRRHLRRVQLDIPTIIITAYNEPNIQERCEAESAALLLKPIAEAVLISAVNLALAVHQPANLQPGK
jgi:FixJ family two-component response regulator